ncbi:MAG TPA: ATP-binding protein [Methanomicrobiales archaeon]|nr:ATP-binding protein [Methanomicrobiales archaeon]
MPLSARISDEDIIRVLWWVSIPLTTLLALVVTIVSVTQDITDVFPHLYYIPILLNAYRNPPKAMGFAALLGGTYAGLVYLFSGFGMDPLVKALIRVLVFVWVAAIVSYLAGILERRNQVLAAMNEIIAAASTSATLAEILSTSGKKIREILRSDVVMVFLADREGKRGLLRYDEGLTEAARGELGSIDLAGEPFGRLVSGGVTELPATAPSLATASLPRLRSFVLIPLAAETRLLGVIAAGSRKSSPLTPDELRMLEPVSRAIGSGVRKALLQEELGEANTKANLYLDIMAHDINNVNTVSLGYAQFLGELVTGKGREMLAKLERAIGQSVEIIHNVSTIRLIQERAQENRPVALDPVIRSEIGHPADLPVHYDGTTATVCANSLLPEVFRNLIGNSAKFGGKGVEIWIRVADGGDHVTVSVEDNGPGIPEDLKPAIFNRFQRGRTTKSGKGLGLYISRMIVEGCGGSIWAGDRVEGEPGKGAAIRFTLRKSCTP